MPSNYAGFDVKIRNADRSEVPVAGATVKIYDAVSLAELATVVADGAGFVAGDVLAVAVGTTVRFRVETHLGMSGFAEQVTT
jgi:hypothetical protein